MKPKEFYHRWRQGIRDLPPSEQLRVKLIAHIGSVVGLLLAGVVLMIKGIWYFIIIIIFAMVLQIVEIIGTNQRFQAAKEMQKQIDLNQLKEIGK